MCNYTHPSAAFFVFYVKFIVYKFMKPLITTSLISTSQIICFYKHLMRFSCRFPQIKLTYQKFPQITLIHVKIFAWKKLCDSVIKYFKSVALSDVQSNDNHNLLIGPSFVKQWRVVCIPLFLKPLLPQRICQDLSKNDATYHIIYNINNIAKRVLRIGRSVLKRKRFIEWLNIA